jgi:hypothetical protein
MKIMALCNITCCIAALALALQSGDASLYFVAGADFGMFVALASVLFAERARS